VERMPSAAIIEAGFKDSPLYRSVGGPFFTGRPPFCVFFFSVDVPCRERFGMKNWT